MAVSSLFAPAFALLISCTLIVHLSPTEAFTVDMIRYDSPTSPFYNPKETDLDRLYSAAHRSFNRAQYFGRAISPLSSQQFQQKSGQLTDAPGGYLLNVSIGTPPVEILAIADTGSDLVWTQCQPCSDCFPQDAPLFDPKRSETYKPVPCGSEACAAVTGTSCDFNVCRYMQSYGDRSHTNGVVSEDTITFGTAEGHPVALPQTIFGCGNDNGGTFPRTASGIIGLGGGAASAVRQTNSLIGGKFSYCLIPHGIEKASKLNFGNDAVVSGNGAVSTPLVDGESLTFYTVTLESVSVAKTTSPSMNKARRSGRHEAQLVQGGNIIVDSGTTLTYLSGEMYSQVEEAVAAQVELERAEVDRFRLCYKAESLEKGFPCITAHFGGGAAIELQPYNSFVKVNKGVWCLAILPANQGMSAIFGNVAMGNFLAGFDVDAKTVSFKPADCTKL